MTLSVYSLKEFEPRRRCGGVIESGPETPHKEQIGDLWSSEEGFGPSSTADSRGSLAVSRWDSSGTWTERLWTTVSEREECK